jgi:sugar lactone lactonase YvrE
MGAGLRVHVTCGLVAIVAAVGVGRAAHGQGTAVEPVNDLPTPYRLVENWVKMPQGRPLGAAAGVAVDRDGRSIWIVDRCGAGTCVGSTVAPILELDATGHVAKSFGAALFVLPHTVNIDRDGNVWVTDTMDKDGKGQQVFKFSNDGKLLMTLGKAGVEGSGPDTFNKPSDVAFARNGDIFVADGHGGMSNARIVKFNKEGKYIKAWGMKGSAPGQFDTPHALLIDTRGRVLVADRGNSGIQIFDGDGNYLTEWKQFGRPSDLFIDRNDVLYVSDSESNSKVNPGWKRGVRIGSAKDGTVTTFIPDLDPDQEAPGGGERESLTVDANGAVFIARTGHGGLLKYVKDPSATAALQHHADLLK